MSNPDRNRMLAKLHILKSQAGLSDENYRDKLELVTGHRSAADCNDAELEKALQMFHGKQKANEPYTLMARALWIAAYNMGALASGSHMALDAFVQRQTGKQLLRFTTPAEANKVTEALKDILARAGFTVPAAKGKDDLEPRRKLLEAQWARLAALGAVRIADTAALAQYVSRHYLGHTGSLTHMTKAQLDNCQARLGSWIRSAQAKAKAAKP